MHPSVERAHATFAWLSAGGGGLLLVGSILKGESASEARFATSFSQTFISRNAGGVLVLIFGLAIIGLAVMLGLGVMPRWGGWIAGGLGAVAGLVALLNLINIANDVSAYGGIVSLGPATPVALLGGVVAATFGTLAAVVRPTSTASAPTFPA
jgi:hypothetical protein